MKLAEVVHIRCGERRLNEPRTFVWVDDVMTEAEFEQFVRAARNHPERMKQPGITRHLKLEA